MNRYVYCFAIIILLLTACSPTTMPQTAVAPTTDDSPSALNPVTPTPERVFATAPAVTKETPANSDAEAHEANSEMSDHSMAEMDNAVLIYERAGGLKGIGPSITTWTMYSDGRVITSDGRSWQVDPTEITTLIENIMALGFADFAPSYIPKDTCCDRATHTITLRQDDKIYQISVLDSTEDVPAEVYQAIDIIGEFLVALPT